jgi:hypothetical protein
MRKTVVVSERQRDKGYQIYSLFAKRLTGWNRNLRVLPHTAG